MVNQYSLVFAKSSTNPRRAVPGDLSVDVRTIQLGLLRKAASVFGAVSYPVHGCYSPRKSLRRVHGLVSSRRRALTCGDELAYDGRPGMQGRKGGAC